MERVIFWGEGGSSRSSGIGAGLFLRVFLPVEGLWHHTEVEGNPSEVSVVGHGIVLTSVSVEAESRSWLQIERAEVSLTLRGRREEEVGDGRVGVSEGGGGRRVSWKRWRGRRIVG